MNGVDKAKRKIEILKDCLKITKDPYQRKGIKLKIIRLQRLLEVK